MREFNTKKLICIYDKTKVRNDAIFESGLVISLSNTTLKEYQKTFLEFLDSLKKVALKTVCCGPLNFDLDMPLVYQLWDMVKEVIDGTNTYMKIFLKIFSIDKGNGFSFHH